MSKTVKFAKPKKPSNAPAPSADAWVGDRTQTIAEKVTEPMKRLTIDIPASLHTRVKVGCAGRGVKMADVMRAFLEKEFPET